MRHSRTKILIAFTALLPSALRSQTLKTIAAIHGRSRETAMHELPAAVEGVVTNTTIWPYGITLQDQTDAVYVSLQPGSLAPGSERLRLGQRIAVHGRTAKGEFAPILTGQKIELKGKSGMPIPRPARADELATGRLDNLYVEVRGVVRTTTRGQVGPVMDTFMVVDMQPGTVYVAVDSSIPLDATQFVDATIRAEGVINVKYNSVGQALGANVLVGRREDISIVRPPSADAFSGPLTPIGDIFRWGADRDWSHRIKVNGVLTLHRPGDYMILQDGGDAIRIESPEKTPLPLGRRFDAAGFAASADFSPVLRDAVIRPTAQTQNIAPALRKPSELLQGGESWVLVRTTAVLTETEISENGWKLDLVEDGIHFSARAPRSIAKELSGLRQGSRLELTGVCQILANDPRRPVGFRILIRSSNDVRLISAGPWLDDPRVLWALFVLGALALLSGGWALALRSRVRHQTRWIAERLRREQVSAALQSQRSKVLELIGRDASLRSVADALALMIRSACPSASPSIAIGAQKWATPGTGWEWIGTDESVSVSQPRDTIELRSASGALRAKLAMGVEAPDADRDDLLQVCRECLSIALEHYDLHRQLLRQSVSDPLTQLPNRRFLDRHMDRALESAREKGTRCAILVLDMDDFKEINDTMGHIAGDLVLQEMASRFMRSMRENDIVARIGGDEFVAVLDGVESLHEADEIAQRIVAEASRTVQISGVSIQPSLSIGISVYPNDGYTAEDLKNRADERMYQAKLMRCPGADRRELVGVR